MVFYNTEIVSYRDVPVIVYPEINTILDSILDRKKKGVIADHITAAYELNKNRFKTLGDYHIDFLWIDKGNLMTDIWVQSETDRKPSGPDSDILVLRKANGGIKPDNKVSMASGTTQIVVGREEEHRRKRFLYSDDLDSYINGKRPDLPFNLASGIDFYI